MSKILKIRNVGDYSQWVGHTDTHPLVSVIDYAEVSPVRHCLNNYSVYGIFFHDEANIDLAYGCGKYDYKEGTVICVAPGQIGGKEDNGELVNLTGWALLFHPDLLQGTALEKHIREYSFFDYRVNEALHMTNEEHDILVSLMRQIKDELQKKHDALQDAILVGYIELMLNFCQRFYNRQFITRKLVNSDMLMKFDQLLRDYYEEKIQLTSGMPTVQYCADKLCMSANYFGDLIKKMTGDTASNYIRQDLIQRVKNELASGASISQVAYELGFEYPQHLSRMFKKFCGYTPPHTLSACLRFHDFPFQAIHPETGIKQQAGFPAASHEDASCGVVHRVACMNADAFEQGNVKEQRKPLAKPGRTGDDHRIAAFGNGRTSFHLAPPVSPPYVAPGRFQCITERSSVYLYPPFRIILVFTYTSQYQFHKL